MSTELLAAFILASAVLALTPGPAMSLIIANGASFGTRAGLLTVAGNSLGLGLLATGAIVGMSSVMAVMADWFDVIRWVGAAYLIWLGASRLYRLLKTQPDPMAVQETPRKGRWFWQGLAVALSNPKVLLFLGAFFPQFVDPQASVGAQLALLGGTFLVVVVAIDSAYAVLAGSARGWLTARRARVAEGVTAGLLICGGVWLAAARRA